RPRRTGGRAQPPGDCRASRTAAGGAVGARRTACAPGPGRAGGGRQGRGSRERGHRSGRPGGGGCAAPRPVQPFTNSIVAVARLRLAATAGRAAVAAAYAAAAAVEEGP